MINKQIIDARIILGKAAITWLETKEVISNNRWYSCSLFGSGNVPKVRLGDPSPEEKLLRSLNLNAGNCGEKSDACYAYLQQCMYERQARFRGYESTSILFCTALSLDHAFVMVLSSDHCSTYESGTTHKMSECGNEALVIDGWNMDWFFPNLSIINTHRFVGFDSLCSINQKGYRFLLQHSSFKVHGQFHIP